MWLFKAINSIVWSNNSSLYKRSNIWFEQTNTKDFKSSSCYQFQRCYRKVKISYEAVSSSKFHTDDRQISLQIFYLILRISYYLSKILTEVALEEKICKSFYWNLRKNDNHHLWWWPVLVMITEHAVQRY